jgi:hypothetical protein
VTKNGDLNPFLLFRLCGVKPLLAILAAKKNKSFWWGKKQLSAVLIKNQR